MSHLRKSKIEENELMEEIESELYSRRQEGGFYGEAKKLQPKQVKATIIKSTSTNIYTSGITINAKP